MKTFFLPAIILMGKLSYSKKLSLLGSMALVATAVVIYALFTSLNQTIQLSQRQLQGLALIEPITRTTQVIQQHRSISTALLGGNNAMQNRLATKAIEIGEAFKTMGETLPSALTAGENFQRIRQDWERLRKEWPQWAVNENFAAHARLIEQFQLLAESVADDYALTLDSELGSSYLIDVVVNHLPHTLEHLGQISAFGIGILSHKQISESQEVEMRVMIGELDHSLKHLNNASDKISRYNPALRNTISATFVGIQASMQKIVDLVASDIFTGQFATPPEAFLDMATTEIDNGYAQAHETPLPATRALIKSRIASAEKTLYVNIGTALLLFLLVAYFAIANYFVIIGSIRSFAGAANAFVRGSLETRVRLDTRDELSQIGAIFNEMAEGFGSMLAARKQDETKMIELAYYDTLTGLPNRTLFYDRLAQEIKKAHRTGLKMAVLYIDLDKFKEVNDTLGHSMGDILLQETARRINDCVRGADTVARLGGDEFIIILSELDDAGNIERVAENILQNLAKPFQLENEIAYVSASIGIILYPDDATGIEDMLKNADQAMYAAKNKGRNSFCYFTPSMQQEAQNKLRLTNELRGALATNQFIIHYQPIMDLQSGRIIKAEALIRWQHPERGTISPVQFIPLAEETGLIVEIGDWVFRKAAQQVKCWRELYNPGFQISVNKSPTQFRQSGTGHDKWLDYLWELSLPGQSIAIEITEGLLLDAESSITDKLLEFRNAGVQVSIDDFGTGYSSLSYLKKFDIDYLKIDQSFVRDLVTDPNDMALSEAIIVMAHKLGLKVIAEGVETEEQRKLLADAGCDYAQGYLFSKPVPFEEFGMLLEKQPYDQTTTVVAA